MNKEGGGKMARDLGGCFLSSLSRAHNQTIEKYPKLLVFKSNRGDILSQGN